MLAEKLKHLVDQLQRPKGEENNLSLAAELMAVMALVESTDDVGPEVFALLPADLRKATLLVSLSVIRQSLD